MHGYSFGLAIDLSSCADVRICARTTRFSVKEVDIGIAADLGTLSRLPKIVGSASWVKDVCLSARIFDAAEALRVGFVSAVLDTKEAAFVEAIKMASLMAEKSPVAVQGTKELLNWSRDRSVEEGLKYTAVWNAAALQTEDVRRAMMAGIQKRTARFEKL
jgi:delta(3,5)-delta(2,4)-dienoyl-CoA isomerase